MTLSSISSTLSRRPGIRLGLLLAAPLTWLVLVYVVALAALLVTAFWTIDSFTNELERTFTLDNIREITSVALYRTVTLRTIGVAVLVTLIDCVIALPVGFYMAKVASRRSRHLLVIAFLMPLWASYLVKALAWRSLLANGGLLDWAGGLVGLGTPGFGVTAIVLTQAYIWLPYVILPVYAAYERVPDSLLDAAGDLGARPALTFRTVVLPLVVPGLIAGSIFSFSLTMGDYITVNIVGGANQMLGNLVYINSGSNLPLAAAIALIPIVVIMIYLALVRRTGALENL